MPTLLRLALAWRLACSSDSSGNGGKEAGLRTFGFAALLGGLGGLLGESYALVGLGLLGILAFIVYPVLPEAPLDAWGLVEPRAAWLTVILIAAIGFVNYILLKRARSPSGCWVRWGSTP